MLLPLSSAALLFLALLTVALLWFGCRDDGVASTHALVFVEKNHLEPLAHNLCLLVWNTPPPSPLTPELLYPSPPSPPSNNALLDRAQRARLLARQSPPTARARPAHTPLLLCFFFFLPCCLYPRAALAAPPLAPSPFLRRVRFTGARPHHPHPEAHTAHTHHTLHTLPSSGALVSLPPTAPTPFTAPLLNPLHTRRASASCPHHPHHHPNAPPAPPSLSSRTHPSIKKTPERFKHCLSPHLLLPLSSSCSSLEKHTPTAVRV